MYKNELEFLGGGRGVQNKKPSVGGVWIFSATAQLFNNDFINVVLLQCNYKFIFRGVSNSAGLSEPFIVELVHSMTRLPLAGATSFNLHNGPLTPKQPPS